MTVESDASTATLGPVVVPKAAVVLANHLRTQIVSGGLPEGSRLPAQSALASRVGLSRGTVREALQILEIEGLVTARSGRAGGSYVRRPDAATLARSLSALVDGHTVHARSLLETRDVLEPMAARLAAMNRTDADLARLDDVSARMHEAVTDVSEFLRCNIDWHLAVVTANHNEVMAVILDALCRAVTRDAYRTAFAARTPMHQALAAHDRVVLAIRQGDPHRAAKAMSMHVRGYRVLVETAPAQT